MNIAKHFKSILMVLAITAICLAASSCDSTAATKQKDSQQKLFDYKQITLDNGLTVVTLEDFSCPIVACQVWYKVGSKDEDPQRQGFAHMFEHMMFKGTDRVGPKDHFGLLQQVGSSTNANTSFDRTAYVQTLPADQIDLAMWLEAERMTFLKIDQEAFDTERNVVQEELRMGENRPYGTMFKKILAELYSVHPYRWSAIGKLDHLRSASVEELRQFWSKYYVPSNATLVVVGAVKHEEAQILAQQYFGWIPKYPVPQRVKIKEPKQTAAKRIVIDNENAPAGLVNIIWRTVPSGHKDETTLDLLGEILGGGNSSRLYRDLVAQRQLSVGASASTFNLAQDGLFFADATQGPTGDLETIETAIWDQIDIIIADGVTKEELDKARNQMLKSVVTTNLTVTSKANLLGTAAAVGNNVESVNTILDDIYAVTTKGIQKAAKKYLPKSNSTTFIIKQNMAGSQAGDKDIADASIESPIEETAPAPGRPGVKRPELFPRYAPTKKLANLITSQTHTPTVLENGLKVIVIPNTEVPFVSVQLGFQAGAWTETKPGTASMALSMLTKGTENYTEAQLAQKLETYAISLGGSASMDTSSVSANCLTENVDLAMELMAEVTLQPTFNDEEFEKLRAQAITGLQVQSQTPRYLAERELKRKIFGSHPYARNADGELEDITALSTDDIKKWWSTAARPDQATLIFAGDIDKDKAVNIAKNIFGNWQPKQNAANIKLPKIPAPAKTHIYIIDQPGSAQSELRIGQLGFTRHQQPDYFVSKLVTYYFGGQFNSRLNETLRIKKGLTYGARGSYSAGAMAGTFRMSTFTKTESTAEALKTMFDEIDKLQNEKPSVAELSDGQKYFIGSFPAQRETPQQIAGDVWLTQSQNLGDDYLERYMKKLAQTTDKDCLNLTNKTLDPEKMVVIIVGDAAKLKDELSKIAPTTVITTPAQSI